MTKNIAWKVLTCNESKQLKITTCIRATNNIYILCYIFNTIIIHNNIVHKVSGGIQLRCDITVKQAIKYAIT